MGEGARCESETNSNTLKSCMHIRSARLTQHIHTLLNVVRYNIHSCTIVHTCRCPQQIPSTRDYHPGHQQRDLSQGGEEVEVNPTSTTPNQSATFFGLIGWPEGYFMGSSILIGGGILPRDKKLVCKLNSLPMDVSNEVAEGVSPRLAG